MRTKNTNSTLLKSAYFAPFIGLFLSLVIKITNSFFYGVYGSRNVISSFVTTFFSTLPKYDTLIAVGSMFAALIFSIAPFLESRKNYIDNIDNHISKKISKSCGRKFKSRRLFEAIDDLKENILNNSSIIRGGMLIFITILIFLSNLCWTLLFFWIDSNSPAHEKIPAVTLISYFCVFLCAISVLYIKDLTYSFRNLLTYEKFLKTKEKYGQLDKKIKSKSQKTSKNKRRTKSTRTSSMEFIFWLVSIIISFIEEIIIFITCYNFSAGAGFFISKWPVLLIPVAVAKVLMSVCIYYYGKNDQPSKINVIVVVFLLILAFMIYGSIHGFSDAAASAVGLVILSISNIITTATSLSLIYFLREIIINIYVRKNNFRDWFSFAMSILSRALVLFTATITLVNSDKFILQDFLKYIFLPVFLYGLIAYILITIIYFCSAHEKYLRDRLVNLHKMVSGFEEDIKDQWNIGRDSKVKVKKRMSIKR